jgi:DNA-binding response OmpR family regulator
LESPTANRKNLGWNCDDTGEKQVVSVNIGQIRKKMIQVDATGSGFIKTIGGYGYRFDPPDRTAMAIYEAYRH